MKRNSTKEEYTHTMYGEIFNHYGLVFWQECMFCEQEFRREHGYRFLIRSPGDWQYSCEDCSKSKKDCNDNLGKWFKKMCDQSQPPQWR